MLDWVSDEIENIKNLSLYRERKVLENVKVFCSNDYLGLKNHPEVVEEAIKVLKDVGLGSGASQLVSGYTVYHKELEEKICEFKSLPSCVLFGSGYLANLGSIGALTDDKDVIFSDELNHASIIDACKLSKAKKFVYRHLDYEHLEELLKLHRRNYRRCLVVTDSVFSMDGDVANIKILQKLAKSYDCLLYLDEAHATGTVGDFGKGALELFNQEWEENIVVMGTLSKALGGYGAFVCGADKLCQYIVNKSRSLIFSTSLPPSLCAGVRKAIEIIQKNPDLIKMLRAKEEKIVKILGKTGYKILYSQTPIIPVIVFSEKKAIELSNILLSRGVFIQAIRYPTVPMGKARLRLTASISYTEEDLETLEKAFLSPSLS